MNVKQEIKDLQARIALLEQQLSYLLDCYR